MNELFSITFLTILLFSTIRLATPLIFAALGGMFSERSGVINIALEGLMLAGAFTAAVATYELQNPYLGFLCGMAAGALSTPRERSPDCFHPAPGTRGELRVDSYLSA